MKLKKVNDCFYHQTNPWSAQSILENGFFVESGGNQRFTEGIYLLSHPEGDYGNTTLKVCVSGNFIDFSHDSFGDEWVRFKRQYWNGNYTDLTNKIKHDYPKADGILFDGMLVVWYPEKIKKVEYYEKNPNH